MSLDTQTKLAIYHHFAETGQRPSLQVVAERVRADVSSVREAYVRLRAQRVLVLEPDGVTIRMAPPFSGVPTQHVVMIDETKYFANCAWDSFGIPAALHRPGRVHSRCEQSDQPLNLEIGLDGPPPCSWLFHCLVPAARYLGDGLQPFMQSMRVCCTYLPVYAPACHFETRLCIAPHKQPDHHPDQVQVPPLPGGRASTGMPLLPICFSYSYGRLLSCRK